MASAKKPTEKKAVSKEASAKKTDAKKAPAAKKPAAPPKKKTSPKAPSNRSAVLLDAAGVTNAIKRLHDGIVGEFSTPNNMLLLGIRTRGVLIAERLRTLLEATYGKAVPTGILDITFYRDDLSRLGPNPTVRGSDLPFGIHDAIVILVDDVLYTGRTIRAAMDELSDFGRPAYVRLATLVDRGLREYPIHADYCGLRIETRPVHHVSVMLEETDDTDQVLLEERPETD